MGDDGELWLSDLLAVHVLPPGTTVAKAWEFNRQLDKQGWTEANLGTSEHKTGSKSYQVAKPVQYVSGGYYILAIKESTDAHVLSAEPLGGDLAKNRAVTIRFPEPHPRPPKCV